MTEPVPLVVHFGVRVADPWQAQNDIQPVQDPKTYGTLYSGCAVVDIDLVAEAGPQAEPFDLGRQLAGLFELQLEPHREHRFAVEKQLHRPTVNQVDVED